MSLYDVLAEMQQIDLQKTDIVVGTVDINPTSPDSDREVDGLCYMDQPFRTTRTSSWPIIVGQSQMSRVSTEKDQTSPRYDYFRHHNLRQHPVQLSRFQARNNGKRMAQKGRRQLLQLPSFEDLGISSQCWSQSQLQTHTPTQIPHDEQPQNSSDLDDGDTPYHYPPQPQPQPQPIRIGAVPLLTPPDESEFIKWSILEHGSYKQTSQIVPSEEDDVQSLSMSTTTQSSSNRPTGITLPERPLMDSDSNDSSSWLARGIGHVVAPLNDSTVTRQIQVVAQSLPSQAKPSNSKPIFEQLLEAVSNQFSYPPYIVITHAVSEAVSMVDIPASPPATPNHNPNHPGNDYFDEQHVVTHAAVVPSYHPVSLQLGAPPNRPSKMVATPATVQVSLLERYIPPSSASEVQEFFSANRKSYLVDRLLELDVSNGRLLLVYPTLAGGTTFKNQYIGPIIEPWLRQFIMLSSLYTNIATILGRTNALPAMLSYDDMITTIQQLCETLSQRSAPRNVHSRFHIEHSETCNVVLDHQTWLNWFIQQEQPRFRQDFVDYHKNGGRMPPSRGHFDVTPGTLTRELIDGIRSSKAQSGGVGIELAVIVIARTAQ